MPEKAPDQRLFHRTEMLINRRAGLDCEQCTCPVKSSFSLCVCVWASELKTSIQKLQAMSMVELKFANTPSCYNSYKMCTLVTIKHTVVFVFTNFLEPDTSFITLIMRFPHSQNHWEWHNPDQCCRGACCAFNKRFCIWTSCIKNLIF